jgi:SAM-dependent methyltransferase
MASIDEVRSFWNSNPLFKGESNFDIGTKEFFIEHEKIVIQDCFAGQLDQKIFIPMKKDAKILDVGCGVGFWIVEFGKRGYHNLYACDLTPAAVEIARKRAQIFGVKAEVQIGNAEMLPYENDSFDHINCQGVIHHTPNTESCVAEFSRILKKDGTASLSVYYRNFFLRCWPFAKWIGKVLSKFGFKLNGRGRENIFALDDVNEIVKLYDGAGNPIGKSYSAPQFIKMLEPYFEIQEVYFHFFPARSLPFKMPEFIHKFFDRFCPFMIYVNLKKR